MIMQPAEQSDIDYTFGLGMNATLKKRSDGLQADRLSDHRYLANLFRLQLHTAAYNLLVRMRHVVADPPPALPAEDLPREALAGDERRQWHNRRREHNPLGEGQPATWRTAADTS